ncbi:MAG TPA: mandelate racemase, partial [Pseudolabrys sp.]|nr:mandelate racemase [Pseudolabrys sp.]
MIPNAAFPPLIVRAIKATPVEVPLNFIMGTSQGAFSKASLILIDLATEEGVVGRSYIFSHMAAVSRAIGNVLQEIETLTKGQRLDPPALFNRLIARFTLIGVQGVIRMAVAGFDVAAWDAAAIGANAPLCRLIGGAPKPVLAYNSCGLGLTPDKGALAAEAEKLLARGFGAVKLRLGYATLSEDIAAVHAVR